MTVHPLSALAEQHLTKAKAPASARSAVTLAFEGDLRQTLIALASGAQLHEHEAPRAATLQVLRGEVQLHWLDQHQDLRAGDLADIPHHRHAVTATEDSVLLLTVLAD